MTDERATLDTYELDDLIDAGTPAPALVGRRVRWHEQYTGTIVELRTGGIAIRIRMACSRCRVRRRTVYATSGCHHGAFCYISDLRTGERLADLRNQIVLCDTCATSVSRATISQ